MLLRNGVTQLYKTLPDSSHRESKYFSQFEPFYANHAVEASSWWIRYMNFLPQNKLKCQMNIEQAFYILLKFYFMYPVGLVDQ